MSNYCLTTMFSVALCGFTDGYKAANVQIIFLLCIQQLLHCKQTESDNFLYFFASSKQH